MQQRVRSWQGIYEWAVMAMGNVAQARIARWSFALGALWLSAGGSCEGASPVGGVTHTSSAEHVSSEAPPRQQRAAFAVERARLVDELRVQGIDDDAVLAAIGRVLRHRMVPEDYVSLAYEDRPLPIGYEQTISQPFVVALMTQLATVGAGDKVLEVGTGSGYQAAVLAELGAHVYTIEIVEPLAERATRTLVALGYEKSVQVRVGDGYAGWPQEAPFDAILLTAAPPEIPEPLIAQLAVGGKLVAPVGREFQQLVVVTMTDDGPRREPSIPVRFVPMTGKAQQAP